MNLFRSEEHVRRWLGDRTPGAILPVAGLAAPARTWWADRLDPGWQPHTREQNQSILDGLGLSGPFWQLG